MPGEAGGASPGGRHGSEDAGMSSESGEKPLRRKPKVSWARLIPQGQPGAKARPQGAADARQADIPVPARARYDRWDDGEGYASRVLDVPVKARREGPRKSGPRISRDARRAPWRSRGFHAS